MSCSDMISKYVKYFRESTHAKNYTKKSNIELNKKIKGFIFIGRRQGRGIGRVYVHLFFVLTHHWGKRFEENYFRNRC